MSRRASYAVIAVILVLGPFASLATVVVVTQPGTFGLDAEVANRLHRLVRVRPGLGQALRMIGIVTEPYVLRVIALVAAVVLWWRGQARTAGWLVLTMAIGGALGVGLKLVFTRDRPYWPDAITVISGYSFPSGHALNSMLAAACAIVLLNPVVTPVGRRLLIGAATAFVLLVGLDRLALGVHFLTDVLAGWALALAVLFATSAALHPHPVRIDPQIEPGSVPVDGTEPGSMRRSGRTG